MFSVKKANLKLDLESIMSSFRMDSEKEWNSLIEWIEI